MITRRATTAEWAAIDPVLPFGAKGLDTTTGVEKYGDGETQWTLLAASTTPPPTFVSPPTTPFVSPKPTTGQFLVPANSATNTIQVTTLGRQFICPLPYLRTSMSFAGIGTNLTIAAVGGTSPMIRLGVYRDDGTFMKPTGTPISGTTQDYDPTAGTGDRYTAWGSPVRLGSGFFWVSWMLVSGSALSTSPTAVGLSTTHQSCWPNLGNNAYRFLFLANTSNEAALPDLTSATLSPISGAMPIVGLKAA